MNSLSNLTCSTSYRNARPLEEIKIVAWLAEICDWHVNKDIAKAVEQLQRTFLFENYLAGVEFTQQVAKMAEQQNHHPDILLSYGKVKIVWWTHAVQGLHKNDFICAAKTEQLYEHLKTAL